MREALARLEGLSEEQSGQWERMAYNGRCRIRTCDPFGVNEVRYHCANRPETWIYSTPGLVFCQENN